MSWRLVNPEGVDFEAIKRNKPEEGWSDLTGHAYGTRYNYCLFVDDICLESLEHMMEPVLKLLERQWGHLEPAERGYIIHPEWEDGQTDEEEEDVGWTYMTVGDYVSTYAHLTSGSALWLDYYARPPTMVDDCAGPLLPGSWRT